MRAISLLALVAGCTGEPDTSLDPVEAYDPLAYVDPFIGTDGLGAQVTAVAPHASAPLGLVFVGPNTRDTDTGDPGFYHFAGYHYADDRIEGFAHTHAHAMGINDYGGIHVMPRAQWDDRYTSDRSRSAPFSHDQEEASPGRYAVDLLDDGTSVEIIATIRGAMHTYDFAAGAEPVVLFDLGHTLGNVQIGEANLSFDVDAGSFEGFQLLQGGYSDRFGGVRTHFVGEFDPAPVASGGWTDPAAPTAGLTSVEGTTSGGWVQFPEGTTQVKMRLAVSYVDHDGAWGNLRDEHPDWDADARFAEVEGEWRDLLSRVRVRGGTEAEKRTFHTALFRSLLMPSTNVDTDGRYRGLDQEVHTADFQYMSDFSLWDTFRTLHPLWILAWPEYQEDAVKSLLRMTEDGGSLPRWPLAHGYTGGMVGSPAQQVLAESYLKGIPGWDPEAAFDLALPAATIGQSQAARTGHDAYRTLGFVSIESSGQPASRTLEYTWSDHSMGVWAEALGRPEAEELFSQSGNWANTYSEEYGFFIGRYADGTFGWTENREYAWTDDFTEGNAWHYVFGVPYDAEGLIDVQHGGDHDAFHERLSTYWDNVADEEDDLLPDDYYWHGNEPVMHYAYMGSLSGAPEITAEASRWVMANRYDDTPLGIDGNDDSGTLSAWYALSAMGIFPIAGTDRYAVGSPLFERIEIDRPDGSQYVIRAPGVETGMYVHGAFLGEEALTAGEFTHGPWSESELVLQMGAQRVNFLSPSE